MEMEIIISVFTIVYYFSKTFFYKTAGAFGRPYGII